MLNKVKALRTAWGWTQAEVGRAVGVSRQAVNAVETEKHDPSLDLAFRLAALFDCPVEAIFENRHVEIGVVDPRTVGPASDQAGLRDTD